MTSIPSVAPETLQMPSFPHRSNRGLVSGATFLAVFIFWLGVGTGWPQQAGNSPADKSAKPSSPPAQSSPSKPPPLEMDTDEPLRLVEPARPTTTDKAKRVADNSACFVCHANFRKEVLASSHASNGVSCVSCHGPSIKHRNDEANIIPPDIMFPSETLDASCGRCHAEHDVEPRLVVERFLEKTSGHAEMKSLVCTSCHGEHRLAVRTVHWDRKTGKLVARSAK
jgi:Cytochrome c552